MMAENTFVKNGMACCSIKNDGPILTALGIYLFLNKKQKKVLQQNVFIIDYMT